MFFHFFTVNIMYKCNTITIKLLKYLITEQTKTKKLGLLWCAKGLEVFKKYSNHQFLVFLKLQELSCENSFKVFFRVFFLVYQFLYI